MKKIISLVFCLVLGSFALAGCADGGEAFEEKSYTPDARVSGVRLDVRDREIAVSLSGDGQVHIGYSESGKEYYDISVSDEAVLTMSSADGKEWTDYIGGKPSAESRKISLQIPDRLLKDLTLSTTNGDISLPALAVGGSISVSCNGGNIAFENLDVGNALFLTAKNGDISGAVAGGYDDFAIRSQVKKGRNNLPEQKDGGTKTLDVSCNNGDIAIDIRKPSAP